MVLPSWLAVIAGMSACGCLWALIRMIQLRERLRVLRRHLEQVQQEKAQTAEWLALAQKEIGVLSGQKEAFGKQQEQMRVEFQNTAHRLFDEASQKMSQQSEQKIGALLHPLSQRIGEFQKQVDERFGTQGKEQHSLKTEIARIVEVNEQMRLQTESLTKALRGDVKAQGNWGEVMLERILEESGLIKGVDYVVQASELHLKSASGQTLRPDVVVHLPEGKHLIIDSKVSLTAYERYCREQEEGLLREFIKSLKHHIVGLEAKRYQDITQLETPDFVFMFLPVEGAFSLALQQDPELHQFAWSRKIALVCPSTLFASLMTIASLWRMERQNKNAQEIARQAGALYDKFVGFVEDLDDLGDKLGRAQHSYDHALQKLSTGHGNLAGRVEKLKKMGATTTKSLPKSLLETEEA